jgi:hypothetical protein
VSITTIIESEGYYTALFMEQIKCTLASLAGDGRVLEQAELEALVEGCSAGAILPALQNHISVQLATCTDNMLDVQTDECNNLIDARDTVREDLQPVDNSLLATGTPVFFFKIGLESTLGEVLADSSIARALRVGAAAVFELEVDHIAVQFKSASASAGNRRLLQTTASVETSVFLYEDERPGATPSRLTGLSPAAMLTVFGSELTGSLIQSYSDVPRLSVTGIGGAVAGAANMPRPVTPPVHPWVLAVTVHVTVPQMSTLDIDEVATVLRATLVDDVSPHTPLTAADVSIRGMTVVPTTGTEFAVWLRFPSEEARSVAAASLRAGPGRGSTLKALVSLSLSSSASQTLQQIGVEDIFVVAISAVEDEEEEEESGTAVSGVPMIVGVAVGSTLLTALAALLLWNTCRSRNVYVSVKH